MTDYPKDDAGQIRTDFVWGNFAPQPNELRTDQAITFGGGTGDHGWEATASYTSDVLSTNVNATIGNPSSVVPVLNFHNALVDGYQNFPGYIENYAGDEDPELEFVVPTLLRKTISEANTILDQYQVGVWSTAHFLTASAIESTGKVVRVTAYDTAFATWSNTANQALNGLRVGDQVDLSALTDDADPAVSLGFGVVKVTNVNNDGAASWFEFKVGTAPEPALDSAAVGTIYAGPNLVDIITVVRPNRGAGTIQNVDGQGIPVRYFGTI